MEKETRAVETILRGVEQSGGFEYVAISFNGGKDCTVLLDLFRKAASSSGYTGKLKAAYVQSRDPFEEMDTFIHYILGQPDYRCFQLFDYKDCGLKEGFEKFISETDVNGVLVGVRNTDPWASGVEEIAETDNGWPKFLRIHPILNWTYSEVWDYLLRNRVPYCRLYDEGYSSIGDRSNSVKNEALRRPDGTYRPAYELEDSSLERSSRK